MADLVDRTATARWERVTPLTDTMPALAVTALLRAARSREREVTDTRCRRAVAALQNRWRFQAGER